MPNILVFTIFLFRRCDFLFVKIPFPFAIMFDGMIDRKLQPPEWLLVRIPVIFCLLKNEPGLPLILAMQRNQLCTSVIRRRDYFYYSGFIRIFLLEAFEVFSTNDEKRKAFLQHAIISKERKHVYICLRTSLSRDNQILPPKMSRDRSSRRLVRTAATLRGIEVTLSHVPIV